MVLSSPNCVVDVHDETGQKKMFYSQTLQYYFYHVIVNSLEQ